MLVAFSVLMLLALAQAQNDRSQRRAEEAAPSIYFAQQFTPSQRDALVRIAASDQVERLLADAVMLEAPVLRGLHDAAHPLPPQALKVLTTLAASPALLEVLEEQGARDGAKALGSDRLARVATNARLTEVLDALDDDSEIVSRQEIDALRRSAGELASVETRRLLDILAELSESDRGKLLELARTPSEFSTVRGFLDDPDALSAARRFGPALFAAVGKLEGGEDALKRLAGGAHVVDADALTKLRADAELVSDAQTRSLAEAARKPEMQALLARVVEEPSDAAAFQKLPGHTRHAVLQLGELAPDEVLSGFLSVASADAVAKDDIVMALDALKAGRLAGEDLKMLASGTWALVDRASYQDAAGRLALLEDQVERSVDLVAQQQADLAARIDMRLGPMVRGLGGRLDEQGVMILPQHLGFEQQKSDLLPGMKAFLTKACPVWIAELKGWDGPIADIRIEGHSSSEWGTDTGRSAFLSNLDLSQRRAAAVLGFCLQTVAGTGELEDWARTRLAAVGYSSSRPVIVDGHEDQKASRRVEFRASVDAGGVIASGLARAKGPRSDARSDRTSSIPSIR